MESLLAFASPDSLKSIIVVMLALFAKDFVVGLLRALKRKLLGDKDPRNDALGEAAGVLADSIERVKPPVIKKL